MSMMKSVFVIRLKSGLQYRAAAWAGIMTQFFWGGMMLMVYRAFYDGAAEQPMTIDQIATYIWLGQAFLGLTVMWGFDKEVTDLIKTGNIAYELARPVRLYGMWFAKLVSGRVANTALRFMPVIIMSFLLPRGYRLSPPVSVFAFILFAVSLALGMMLIVSIYLFLTNIGFYTIDVEGFVGIFMMLAYFFSGHIVPIALFPDNWQKIFYMTPFPYMHDIAYRIYCGNIGTEQRLKYIMVEIVWLAVFIFLGEMLLNKGIKRVVAQGG